MRPCIGRQERKAMAEALAQAGLQGVVAGIRDTGDFTDRTVNATGWRVRQGASRIEATVVHIVFGGIQTRGCHGTARASGVEAGDKDGWISFDKPRQSHSGRTHVSDLK